MFDTKYRKQAMLIWEAERESAKEEWKRDVLERHGRLSRWFEALHRYWAEHGFRRKHT